MQLSTSQSTPAETATQREPCAATGSEPVTLSVAQLDQDPHGLFRRYRAETPLINRDDGIYVVIRAADVERLATDPRTRQVETEVIRMRGVTEGALFDFFNNSMLFTNGRDHRRRRAPLSRTFAVRLIAELRPRIRAVAEELIDEVYSRREMSFLDHYCALIPARTISAILGIPDNDIARFTSWVYTMSRSISASFTPADIPEIEDAARHLTAYVSDLLDARRASPRNDFLTDFARAVDEEASLSPLEALIQIVTVIIGGSDTTRAAMAVQVALLLRHRELWDAVCNDEALIPGAVSEALRYEPVVGSIPRFTLEDIEIDGHVVPRHRMMSLSTISAMRDPAVYADPDTFDIRRTDHPRRHPVFGSGAHRCLGEALARAELEEGLAALAARLPRLELAGEPPTVHGHSGIRRVSGMRVRWP